MCDLQCTSESYFNYKSKKFCLKSFGIGQGIGGITYCCIVVEYQTFVAIQDKILRTRSK